MSSTNRVLRRVGSSSLGASQSGQSPRKSDDKKPSSSREEARIEQEAKNRMDWLEFISAKTKAVELKVRVADCVLYESDPEECRSQFLLIPTDPNLIKAQAKDRPPHKSEIPEGQPNGTAEGTRFEAICRFLKITDMPYGYEKTKRVEAFKLLISKESSLAELDDVVTKFERLKVLQETQRTSTLVGREPAELERLQKNLGVKKLLKLDEDHSGKIELREILDGLAKIECKEPNHNLRQLQSKVLKLQQHLNDVFSPQSIDNQDRIKSSLYTDLRKFINSEDVKIYQPTRKHRYLYVAPQPARSQEPSRPETARSSGGRVTPSRERTRVQITVDDDALEPAAASASAGLHPSTLAGETPIRRRDNQLEQEPEEEFSRRRASSFSGQHLPSHRGGRGGGHIVNEGGGPFSRQRDSVKEAADTGPARRDYFAMREIYNFQIKANATLASLKKTWLELLIQANPGQRVTLPDSGVVVTQTHPRYHEALEAIFAANADIIEINEAIGNDPIHATRTGHSDPSKPFTYTYTGGEGAAAIVNDKLQAKLEAARKFEGKIKASPHRVRDESKDKEIAAQGARISEMQGELARLRERLRALEAENRELKEAKDKALQAQKNAQKDLDEAKRAKQEADRERDEARSDLARLEAEMSEIQTALAQARQEAQRNGKAARTHEGSVEELQRQLDALRREHAEQLAVVKSHAQQAQDALNAQLQALQAFHEAAQERLRAQEQELARLRQENELQREAIAALRQELQQAHSANQSFNAQLREIFLSVKKLAFETSKTYERVNRRNPNFYIGLTAENEDMAHILSHMNGAVFESSQRLGVSTSKYDPLIRSLDALSSSGSPDTRLENLTPAMVVDIIFFLQDFVTHINADRTNQFNVELQKQIVELNQLLQSKLLQLQQAKIQFLQDEQTQMQELTQDSESEIDQETQRARIQNRLILLMPLLRNHDKIDEMGEVLNDRHSEPTEIARRAAEILEEEIQEADLRLTIAKQVGVANESLAEFWAGGVTDIESYRKVLTQLHEFEAQLSEIHEARDGARSPGDEQILAHKQLERVRALLALLARYDEQERETISEQEFLQQTNFHDEFNVILRDLSQQFQIFSEETLGNYIEIFSAQKGRIRELEDEIARMKLQPRVVPEVARVAMVTQRDRANNTEQSWLQENQELQRLREQMSSLQGQSDDYDPSTQYLEQIKSLQEQIRQMNEEREQWQQELEAATSRLEQFASQHAQREEQGQRLNRQQQEQFNQELQRRQALVDGLRGQLEESVQATRDVEQEKEALQARLQQMEQRFVQQMQEERARYEQEQQELAEVAREAQAQTEELLEELQQLPAREEELRQQYARELQEMRRQFASRSGELSRPVSVLSEREDALNRSNAEGRLRDEYERQLAAIRQEAEELRRALAAAREREDGFDDEIRVSELQEAEARQGMLREHSQEIQTLTEQLQRQQQAWDEQHRELEEARAANERIAEEDAALRHRLAELEELLASRRDEYERTTTEIRTEYEQTITRLREEYQSIQQAVEHLEQELRARQREVELLCQRMEEAIARVREEGGRDAEARVAEIEQHFSARLEQREQHMLKSQSQLLERLGELQALHAQFAHAQRAHQVEVEEAQANFAQREDELRRHMTEQREEFEQQREEYEQQSVHYRHLNAVLEAQVERLVLEVRHHVEQSQQGERMQLELQQAIREREVQREEVIRVYRQRIREITEHFDEEREEDRQERDRLIDQNNADFRRVIEGVGEGIHRLVQELDQSQRGLEGTQRALQTVEERLEEVLRQNQTRIELLEEQLHLAREENELLRKLNDDNILQLGENERNIQRLIQELRESNRLNEDLMQELDEVNERIRIYTERNVDDLNFLNGEDLIEADLPPRRHHPRRNQLNSETRTDFREHEETHTYQNGDWIRRDRPGIVRDEWTYVDLESYGRRAQPVDNGRQRPVREGDIHIHNYIPGGRPMNDGRDGRDGRRGRPGRDGNNNPRRRRNERDEYNSRYSYSSDGYSDDGRPQPYGFGFGRGNGGMRDQGVDARRDHRLPPARHQQRPKSALLAPGQHIHAFGLPYDVFARATTVMFEKDKVGAREKFGDDWDQDFDDQIARLKVDQSTNNPRSEWEDKLGIKLTNQRELIKAYLTASEKVLNFLKNYSNERTGQIGLDSQSEESAELLYGFMMTPRIITPPGSSAQVKAANKNANRALLTTAEKVAFLTVGCIGIEKNHDILRWRVDTLTRDADDNIEIEPDFVIDAFAHFGAHYPEIPEVIKNDPRMFNELDRTVMDRKASQAASPSQVIKVMTRSIADYIHDTDGAHRPQPEAHRRDGAQPLGYGVGRGRPA